MASGRGKPDHRPQEERAAADQCGRDQTAFDVSRLIVEIGEQGFHQLGALAHPGFDRHPFRALDQQRYGRDGPRPFVRLADDAEAGPDILGMTLYAFARMAEIVARDGAQFLEHRTPGGGVRRGAQHVAI